MMTRTVGGTATLTLLLGLSASAVAGSAAAGHVAAGDSGTLLGFDRQPHDASDGSDRCNVRALAATGQAGRLASSPNGRHVLYADRCDRLRLVDLSTCVSRDVTPGGFYVVHSPAWSGELDRDGVGARSRIAFAGSVGTGLHIYTLDVTTGDDEIIAIGSLRQITFDPATSHDELPAFAPDGRSIAFVRWQYNPALSSILTVDLARGQESLLYSDPNEIHHLAWVPPSPATPVVAWSRQ